MPKKPGAPFTRCHISLPQVERDALAAFASYHNDCSISLILSCLINHSGIVEWYEANDGRDPPANILITVDLDLDEDALRVLAIAAAKNGVSMNEMLHQIMSEAKRSGEFDKLPRK